MAIFVTGGAGFIGSNFILDWFEQSSEPVVNIDKLTYAGNPYNLESLSQRTSYNFIQGDIGDKVLFNKLFKRFHPRAMINFAAESHVDRSIDVPATFIDTNIVGTFHLLEETRNYWQEMSRTEQYHFRFLHVSTDEVYGSLKPDEPAFTEATPYAPNSPYSASKASSDHLVRSYYHTYGLPTLTTNCSNNYGPFQFPEKLIPLVINNALCGSPLPIYGDGQQIRDWLYVKDHCTAIRHVLEKGEIGEVYNIGGKNEWTNIDIVKKICGLLDEKMPQDNGHSYTHLITYVTDRPGHDRRYAIDNKKIECELGWSPSEDFESGLRKTVDWYLTHQGWVQNLITGKYQDGIRKSYA